jgi:hypothetical protein
MLFIHSGISMSSGAFPTASTYSTMGDEAALVYWVMMDISRF